MPVYIFNEIKIDIDIIVCNWETYGEFKIKLREVVKFNCKHNGLC